MQVKDETAKKRKQKTAAKPPQAAAAKPAALKPVTAKPPKATGQAKKRRATGEAAKKQVEKKREINNGRGGRGRGRGGANHSGRGRGQGQNYTGSANAAKRSMCTNIGTNVFDYGKKSAADQMRTSLGKLVQYVVTNYGQGINNELQNKVWVVLTEHVHTDDVLARHSVREVMILNGQLNIHQARQAQETILKASVQTGTDMDAPMKLAIL
jgi:hypothetical protein